MIHRVNYALNDPVKHGHFYINTLTRMDDLFHRVMPCKPSDHYVIRLDGHRVPADYLLLPSHPEPTLLTVIKPDTDPGYVGFVFDGIYLVWAEHATGDLVTSHTSYGSQRRLLLNGEIMTPDDIILPGDVLETVL